MKQLKSALLSVLLLLTLTSCGNKPAAESSMPAAESSLTVQEPDTPAPAPTVLVNKMTDTERKKVSKHALTLLDPPEEPKQPQKPADGEHKVCVEFAEAMSDEDLLAAIESNLGSMTDADYEKVKQLVEERKQHLSEKQTPAHILVDGLIMPYYLPEDDFEAKGVPFSFSTTFMNDEGRLEQEEHSFQTFSEYLDWIRQRDEENGYSAEETELDLQNVQIAYEALRSGNFETLAPGTIDVTDRSIYIGAADSTRDCRENWEYDRAAVEAIKDSVEEFSFYNEETDQDFLVHVTLPPGYDADKTYPVLFLTDGIWRFGDCPALRKLMENGEAAPVLLVTLYYGYFTDDSDGGQRYNDLVIERDTMLDFITDNVMPYLTEHYRIDCANSTLYGHSDGGVFTHNALFKSDQYENQPFGRYIIGSPALWGLYNYNDYCGIDNADCLNDYGYFDRNPSLNKRVFLCAGAQEDPDYADQYNGHDTTLEGTEKLKKRLESHGADLTYKLYDSHHYQYIPEMLAEYLKTNYPA